MKTTIYNKLIRDKIPDIIQTNNQQASVRTLSKSDYFIALKKKLVEEVEEFCESEELEELADILEVIYALADYANSDPASLEQLRLKKRAKRGGFEKRIFLEAVTST